MFRAAPLLLGLLALPTTAAAQEDAPAPEVQYTDETVLEENAFRALHIESLVVGPGGERIVERSRAAAFPVLFRLRMNFNDELSESVDDVR